MKLKEAAWQWLFGEQPFWKRWAKWLLVAMATFVVLYVVFWIANNRPPELYVSEIKTTLDFKNRAVLAKQITTITAARAQSGIPFSFEGREFAVRGTEFGQKVFSYDAAAIADNLWNQAHPDHWWLPVRVSAAPFPATMDETALNDALKRKVAAVVTGYVPPRVTLGENGIGVTAEALANELDIPALAEALHEGLAAVTMPKIAAKAMEQKTGIPLADAEEFVRKQSLPMDVFPLTLLVGEGDDAAKATLSKDEWFSFLAIGKNADGELRFTFVPEGFAWLEGTTKGLKKEPENGSITMENGKVLSFDPAAYGTDVDLAGTVDALVDAWLNVKGPAHTATIALAPNPEEGTAAKYGIVEIVGTGKSNFSGSPANRRTNIAVGAKSVNGTLVLPGEEFSLLKVLGEINGDTGYLPELVIKENKTVPEFGGGLCQIGTTTFRGALSSGLPITMRQNHSYRVRYYEPAGTDATIYDPMPDFRFKNDMATAILIRARVLKNELLFEFWGTKDGRAAEYPAVPKVYNITPPPPMKLIETAELKPGEKKCTESAHDGAEAIFDYEIKYADGKSHKQTFKSKYRPWQAVCLVGIDPNKKEEAPAPETLNPAPLSIDIPSADPVVR